MLNPELIVEVASRSTVERDRTWKLERYLFLESVREYWILETEAPRLQQYVHTGGDWVLRTASGEEAVLRCAAFDLEVPLVEPYRLVFE